MDVIDRARQFVRLTTSYWLEQLKAVEAFEADRNAAFEVFSSLMCDLDVPLEAIPRMIRVDRSFERLRAKLSNIITKEPNTLPGIGRAYVPHWQDFGCITAVSVLGCFLKEGTEGFRNICSEEIGMSANCTHDLLSALEARWNTLAMVGRDIEELLAEQGPAVGEHFSRWGPFVNAKMSGLRMSDVPGVGPTVLDKLRTAGFYTPTQLLGEFIHLGSEDFFKFITDKVGILAVGTNKNPHEMTSALQAKWDALGLVGRKSDSLSEKEPSERSSLDSLDASFDERSSSSDSSSSSEEQPARRPPALRTVGRPRKNI